MYEITERSLTDEERAALTERREELESWPTALAAARTDWPRRVRWVFVLALIGISALYFAPEFFPYVGAACVVAVFWILSGTRGPREVEEQRQVLETRVATLIGAIDRVLEGGVAVACRVEARAVRGIEAWAQEVGDIWVFEVGPGRLLALDAFREFPDDPDAPWPSDKFTLLRETAEGESVLILVEGGQLEPMDVVTQRDLAFGLYVEGEGEPRLGPFDGTLEHLARDFEPRAAQRRKSTEPDAGGR